MPFDVSHHALDQRTLDRRSDRGLAYLLGRDTVIFSGSRLASSIAVTTGRLELGLQDNTAGETQSPTALAGCGKIRLSFRGGSSGRNPGTQAKPLFLSPVFMGSGFHRCAPAGMTAI